MVTVTAQEVGAGHGGEHLFLKNGFSSGCWGRGLDPHTGHRLLPSMGSLGLALREQWEREGRGPPGPDKGLPAPPLAALPSSRCSSLATSPPPPRPRKGAGIMEGRDTESWMGPGTLPLTQVAVPYRGVPKHPAPSLPLASLPLGQPPEESWVHDAQQQGVNNPGLVCFCQVTAVSVGETASAAHPYPGPYPHRGKPRPWVRKESWARGEPVMADPSTPISPSAGARGWAGLRSQEESGCLPRCSFI